MGQYISFNTQNQSFSLHHAKKFHIEKQTYFLIKAILYLEDLRRTSQIKDKRNIYHAAITGSVYKYISFSTQNQSVFPSSQLLHYCQQFLQKK